MARAVITGASGSVGAAVAHALARQGDDVVRLDTQPGPGVIVADVSRPGEWAKQLVGADLVVHAVAVATGGVGELGPVRGGVPARTPRVSDEEFRRVVLGGTTTVLDAAESAQVGRVVQVSGVGALGPAPGHFDESVAPAVSALPRADVLAAAELLGLDATRRGTPVTIARLGDVYGPRSGRWTIWPVLLMRAGRFALPDDRAGLLAPVHVDDAAAAVVALAGAPPAAGEIVQVTGGEVVPVPDYFAHYSRMLNLARPRFVPAAVLRALGEANLPPSATGGSAHSPGRFGRVADRLLPAPDREPAAGARGLLALPRAITARALAAVDPRERIDLGPLTVTDLTRRGTFATEKIHRLAGWRPALGLDEGMARTEAALRERGLLGVPEPSRRG